MEKQEKEVIDTVKSKTKEQKREETVKEVEKEAKEAVELEEAKKIIDNNVVEFVHNDIDYRIVKPSFKQKQEVYKKRCEKQVEFLQETNKVGGFVNMSEKDLKIMYKRRGIDIDQMNRKLKVLSIKENEFLGKLGKELKEKQTKKQMDFYEAEIEKVREEIQLIVSEKASLLEFSIESQLLSFIYSYFAILVTETKVEDNWVRVWNNMDELLNGDDQLITKAISYLTVLFSEQLV